MIEGVALQLYTLREQAADDYIGMLTEVAAAGYEAVEFAGFGGLPVADLRGQLDDLGLRALSAHVPYRRFVSEAETVIAELNTLGCHYAVIPGLPEEMRDLAAVPRLADQFNTWGSACRGAGLRFGYHNHGWELAAVDGTTMLDALLTATEASLVDMQLDVFWALAAGADPAALLRRYAGRAPTLHAKERAAGPETRDTVIGEGITPWPAVLAAATDADTRWLIVEQEDDPPRAYRDIRQSLHNLRVMLAGESAPVT